MPLTMIMELGVATDDHCPRLTSQEVQHKAFPDGHCTSYLTGL